MASGAANFGTHGLTAVSVDAGIRVGTIGNPEGGENTSSAFMSRRTAPIDDAISCESMRLRRGVGVVMAVVPDEGGIAEADGGAVDGADDIAGDGDKRADRNKLTSEPRSDESKHDAKSNNEADGLIAMITRTHTHTHTHSGQTSAKGLADHRCSRACGKE